MDALKILIADDEPLVRDTLKAYLSEVKGITYLGECKNGKEVVKQVKLLKPDVLLLDIHMPELTGLEALKEIEAASRPMVIFITAYDEYALKAFELHAIDYLLKPVLFERLEEALEKAARYKRGADNNQLQAVEKLLKELANRSPEEQPQTSVYLTRILVKENKKYFFVPVESVYCFEGAGDHVLMHLEKAKHYINDSLTSLESRLDPHHFMRIHRSTIINVNYIHTMERYFNGEFHITLKNAMQVKLSRYYKDNLKAYLSSRDEL